MRSVVERIPHRIDGLGTRGRSCFPYADFLRLAKAQMKVTATAATPPQIAATRYHSGFDSAVTGIPVATVEVMAVAEGAGGNRLPAADSLAMAAPLVRISKAASRE
jgi:hypothetical protein